MKNLVFCDFLKFLSNDKGVDTGRALGADFKSYCCLCSRMVSAFRSRADWISLSGQVAALFQLGHQLADCSRGQVKMDSNRLVCYCKPRYDDMLATSCVPELLARAKGKRTLIIFYLELPRPCLRP